MNRTALVWDDSFKAHLADAPGHPETPERLTAMYNALRTRGLDRSTLTLPLRVATEEDITLVHSLAHLRQVEGSRHENFSAIDPDTWMTSGSYEAAMTAAGSSIALVDAILDDVADNGFALVRPPGHHAVPRRGMGFCLFNNVAIAAEHLLRRRGLAKVAVVDFDVHHGNGTQDAFYDRADLLYVSTHQSPFYPGSGHFDEVGEGAGKGYTVNLPLLPGNGDHEYLLLFTHIIVPILEEYAPDFLLVSAGYDLHRADPIGGMQLSTEGITRIAALLCDCARRVCKGRVAFFLEGGYNLEASAACVVPTVETLQGVLESSAAIQPQIPGSRILPVLRQAKTTLSPHWKCLSHLTA